MRRTHALRRRRWTADRTMFVRVVLTLIGLGMGLSWFLQPGAADPAPPPDPIDPTKGEATLLRIIDGLPLNEIKNALDHFPVPYVVVASADGAAPTIKNNRAGHPTRVDADRSKATGLGGFDISVEVNTELEPTPHLRLTVDRLGASLARDLTVVVAFPFDAFNDEDADLPGDPNLFFGFQTTGAFDGTDYPAGGNAPLSVDYLFTPEILAGTSHDFRLGVNTTGATNPIRYIGGHFDGNVDTGILNATGIAALEDPVPSSFELSIGTNESAIDLSTASLTDTAFELGWTSSAPAKVVFDYLENEDFPFGIPDYNTTLTIDQMPTSETLSLRLDEDEDDADDAIDGLVLSHRANAPIGSVTFLKEREDGLMIRGTGTDVPTEVDLGVDLDGEITLDVNENTLDLSLQLAQRNGFFDTGDFMSYDVGYVQAGLVDAPDLTARFQPSDDSYRVEATNPGESIGAVEVVLDDGPVRVLGGGIDMDADGDVDGDDDGDVSGMTVTDGSIDAPDGILPGSVPAVSVVGGRIDISGDGTADGVDVRDVTVLALPPAFDEPPTRHILSFVDDGGQGTVAGRAVAATAAALDLDSPPVIAGRLDLNGDGTADDDGAVNIDKAVIGGLVDLDGNGVADDNGELYGRTVIAGALDMNDDGTIDAADDGALTAQSYRLGTALAAPMQIFVSTEETSTLIPGRNVDATCDVTDVPAALTNAELAFPPPTVYFAYDITPEIGIEEISCAGHVDDAAFEALAGDLPSEFAFVFDPDGLLRVKAEDGSGPNSATVGVLALRLCDDPNEDGACVAGENGAGIDGTGELLGEPARDARARVDDTPSFIGRWSDGGATAAAGRITATDENGTVGLKRLVGDQIDVNGDGAITGADDGFVLGKRVVNGRMDVDGDGDTDSDDNGTISGTAVDFDTGNPDAELFLAGAQVAVRSVVGLDPLPEGDASADHYARFRDAGSGLTPPDRTLASGAFGIDEFAYSSDDTGRAISLRYDANQDHRLVAEFQSGFGGLYLPEYSTDLTLTVDDVPQTWDLYTNLATDLDYTASSGIDSITLAGTIDDTNDGNAANGTEVDAQILELPSRAAFHVAASPTKVIGGKLDTSGNGTIGGEDDAVLAGARVIDGALDLNFDGSPDTGEFVGVPVVGGVLDMDADGSAGGDGELAGAVLNMNGPIDLVSIELQSTNQVVETDGFRLVQLTIDDIPARWAVNWGGGRFLLETKDAAGAPAPLGQISAVVSSSNSAAQNAAKREPFTLDGPAHGGPILGGTSGGCRFDYSAFLQEVDKRYYNAAPDDDPSNVFPRLRDLYCDSEQLDPGEDHVIARFEDVDGDGQEDDLGFGSFQFTGFQKLSWIPNDNGGDFEFRAPVPGTHPIFGGFEKADEFTTIQVGNIPDEVKVHIDTTQQVTYDAGDDTDASLQEIDVYQGPLPKAADGVPATRLVVNFVDSPSSTTSCDSSLPAKQCIHVGWNFGFPSGGAFLDSSEEIEVLLLTQSEDFRIAGGLGLEDLHFGYGIELFSFDVTKDICLLPDPFDGCLVPEVPVAWEIAEAKAGIDNDADGFALADIQDVDPDSIAANHAKADLAGFLAVYQRRNGIAALDPAGPAAGAREYVPLVTVEEENFREFSISMLADLDPTNLDAEIKVPPGIPLIDFEGPTVKVTGDLIIDFWVPVDATKIFDVPFIGDVGFLNPPDYSENSPIHVLPGIQDPFNPDVFRLTRDRDLVFRFDGWHHFHDHFDPFAA